MKKSPRSMAYSVCFITLIFIISCGKKSNNAFDQRIFKLDYAGQPVAFDSDSHYVQFNVSVTEQCVADGGCEKFTVTREISSLPTNYTIDLLHEYQSSSIAQSRKPNFAESYISVSIKTKNGDHSVYSDNLHLQFSNTIPMLKLLGEEYGHGTDGHSIYHMYSNEPIKGVDVDSFEAINGRFGRDKNHVFYIGTIIDTATVDKFEVLSLSYSRDASHVFYEEKLVEDADVGSFSVLESTQPDDHDYNPKYLPYATDNTFGYFNGRKIDGDVDVTSMAFKYCWAYDFSAHRCAAEDKTNIYENGVIQ